MIKSSCLILFLLLSITLCVGQADFRPGYVVLFTGDTLHGAIDYRGDVFMSTMCKLKQADGSITTYYAAQLRSYRLVNSKYYVSRDVKVDGEIRRVFLEMLAAGAVNILYFRSDVDRYYIEKDSLGISELPYKEIETKKDGKHLKAASTQHIGVLMYYLQDAPELRGEIERIKRPEAGPLIRLAEKYNMKRSATPEKTEYLKSAPSSRIYIDLAGGPAFPKSTEILTQRTFVAGVQFLFGMPRYNEKLFFRTGLIISDIQPDEGLVLRRIPIALEYMPMNRRINLRASYGMNLYNYLSTTISLAIGVNARVTDRISLVLIPESEFGSKFLFLPQKLEAFNVHAGANIRLK